MEQNKNSRKIIILGMILLILAGLIVVALKGFHVSLMFGKHEVIELKVGTEVNLDIMREIGKETFQHKNFVVKELELFGDSVQINIDSITDEEKTVLIEKINEKFGTAKTVEDLNVYSVSNKRIRDVVRPYGAPMITSFIIVFIYMLIRFRNLNAVKSMIDFIKNVILTEAILLSVIAITRIAVTDLLINILILIPVAELIYLMVKNERKLELQKEQ